MTMDTIRTRKDVAKDLSQKLGTKVAPAGSADPEYGDTLIFADVDGETQAYLANGAVQNTAMGEADYVEQWGVLSDDSNLGATANQYSGEIPDEVAAMYESDVAFQGKEVQRRDETTDVSLEPETREAGEGFVERALEEGTHGLRAD